MRVRYCTSSEIENKNKNIAGKNFCRQAKKSLLLSDKYMPDKVL